MDFGGYFQSAFLFCRQRQKDFHKVSYRTSDRPKNMGKMQGHVFERLFLVFVQIIRYQLRHIYTCKNIVKNKVIFQRFTIENPVLYIKNHEAKSWVKMNGKFSLNIMTSERHILVIYRGYFRFAEKRIGSEELQEEGKLPGDERII